MSKLKGSFTLPGESGYEQLTLDLAEKWGADMIRDSDGTQLSDEILDAGYGIYSTICVIRGHNDFARKHPDMLQQSFLMAGPVLADSEDLAVVLMENFYDQQFRVNEDPSSLAYWQVYDRTSGQEVPRENWEYDPVSGSVRIHNCTLWHRYSVSFLAFQIWEQISMYNHVTNDWGDQEHLMPLDPAHPEVRSYLLDWLDDWCKAHPVTKVVRFTSLFYNFTWMWGSDERNRFLFTDWASYDFTVSPLALDAFEKEAGYRLTAEDFVNKGHFQVTHMPPTGHKKDWMDFINRFVVQLGKEMVDVVHKYGKLAYVFYDDTWVGMEPYGERFASIGFDGIIKCVFSGYEARLCSGVPAKTHEIRLHPYLFPVGLGGAPTFMEGGNPTRDAAEYWVRIRRGLLRAPIQRIGLGGYLHLTEDFPDFQDYIEQISDEFRLLEEYHENGAPIVIEKETPDGKTRPVRVAVLHTWGHLRSWTLSGHFHETWMHPLIHINEALAGMPLQVDFLSFEDVRNGALADVDVVINAGKAGDAWSGGEAWKDDRLVEELTRFVCEGGAFIGVREPSALAGYDTYYRMAGVLGLDQDTGSRVCHGRWSWAEDDAEAAVLKNLIPQDAFLPFQDGRMLTDGKAKVLMSEGGIPQLTWNRCGKGTGIYMSDFTYTPENARLLLNLILKAVGKDPFTVPYIAEDPRIDCAYFPEAGKLVIVSSAPEKVTTQIHTGEGMVSITLPPYGQVIR